MSNAYVFQAAVKAIGSNSRSWATFLKNERRLSGLLGDYDPLHTYRAFEEGRLGLDEVKACLPGQPSSADASAIRRWARLLSEVEDYYGYIRTLGSFFGRQSKRSGESLPDHELLLCLVGYLGNPPRTHPKMRLPDETGRRLRADQVKLPGMGYALGSEFFRNLGWNGFKPDRHVQRLFDQWFPLGVVDMRPEVQRLQRLIGRKTKGLSIYLTYSLMGISSSPPGVTFSYVDNLVWLLGAYVEKKGRESNHTYLTRTG